MEKTLDDVATELKDSVGTLLDEIREQVAETVSVDDNSQSEEYADGEGWTEVDEDEWGDDDEMPSPNAIRTMLINAYTAGRDATLSALEDAVNEAKD